MEQQRERSRAGAGRDERAAEFAKRPASRREFVGYEKTDVLTQIGALEELGDGVFLAKLRESPFYAAGGGQVTDAGLIEHEETRRARRAAEAYRLGDDQVLLFEGEGFAEGDRVRAVVAWAVRFPTMANHTATHLLHKALRDVLGDHVRQAGLGGASGQAPLRLHASAGADDGGARPDRAARQREGVREPARCARS